MHEEIQNEPNKNNIYKKISIGDEEKIVDSLKLIIKEKDSYTSGHCNRVSAYSVLLGKYLNLSDKEIEELKLGGLFHDIGKVNISDNILNKETSLTENEYLKIKNHPSIGSNILASSNIFKDIIPIVEHHHEKYDGTGYPAKIKGEDIPYLARIATIADTFDAMTSKRSYREALPLKTVISEFEKCKGTQFDPEIADVFLDILKNHYDEIEKIQKDYT